MSLAHTHLQHESMRSGVLACVGEALSRKAEGMDDRARGRAYMRAQRDGAKRARAMIASGELQAKTPKRTIKLDR